MSLLVTRAQSQSVDKSHSFGKDFLLLGHQNIPASNYQHQTPHLTRLPPLTFKRLLKLSLGFIMTEETEETEKEVNPNKFFYYHRLSLSLSKEGGG